MSGLLFKSSCLPLARSPLACWRRHLNYKEPQHPSPASSLDVPFPSPELLDTWLCLGLSFACQPVHSALVCAHRSKFDSSTCEQG